MFIISLTYILPMEEVERHLQAHVAFLDTYYAAGTFVCSGRKVPRTGGVIIACGKSRAEIEAIVRQDPFHIHGVAAYDITEVMLTKTIDALNPVFDQAVSP